MDDTNWFCRHRGLVAVERMRDVVTVAQDSVYGSSRLSVQRYLSGFYGFFLKRTAIRYTHVYERNGANYLCLGRRT